ncbi:hypothetical protein Q1695_015563 [Nippostrongylus brasiliensis]|nr:hypothetical protein Q1695_015563 [Nippostrongylus brasiliensis]
MRLVRYGLGLLAVLIDVCNASLSCASGENYSYSCMRDVILAIDATSNMGTVAGIRSEFDFIENWVIPRLDIRPALVSIGMTTTIRNLFNNFGFDSTSLVLFTGDRDQSDVDAAGAQVEYYIDNKLAVDFSVVVVNYGNCSFKSWPASHTDEYDATTMDPSILSMYVDNSICEPTYTTLSTSTPTTTISSTAIPTQSSTVVTTSAGTTAKLPADTSPTTAPNAAPTTKPAPSGSITNTPRQQPIRTSPTPTIAPTSGLPTANINNTGCNCVLKTVWLDVFLLMEASTSMTQTGIDSATDYVVSAMSKLTIGQSEQYQTRFGVIRYASNVELIADLDAYTTTSDLFDLNISLMNETGTNIEGAIRLATSKFTSKTHRTAARPVLIIVGSSYKIGGYNDPTQIAGQFRQNGIIITIEYVQQHGLSVPMLRSIATSNYNLTNQNADGSQLRADDLRHLLCEANCFCRANWNPYLADMWSAPQGGCYYPIDISSIKELAVRTCKRENGAVLALDEDFSKNMFLLGLLPSKTKFWLGLQYDGAQWTWSGQYSVGYTNWAPNQPNINAGQCAYMQQYSGFSSGWFSNDCGDDHNYICQSRPCDSTNYCAASTV